MSNNQVLRIKKPLKFDDWAVRISLQNLELVVEEFETGTMLRDIVHDDISKITAKPVKRIKIGNGGQSYNELKSIIILDNADFIIVDKDGYIIDYITNSNPYTYEPIQTY